MKDLSKLDDIIINITQLHGNRQSLLMDILNNKTRIVASSLSEPDLLQYLENSTLNNDQTTLISEMISENLQQKIATRLKREITEMKLGDIQDIVQEIDTLQNEETRKELKGQLKKKSDLLKKYSSPESQTSDTLLTWSKELMGVEDFENLVNDKRKLIADQLRKKEEMQIKNKINEIIQSFDKVQNSNEAELMRTNATTLVDQLDKTPQEFIEFNQTATERIQELKEAERLAQEEEADNAPDEAPKVTTDNNQEETDRLAREKEKADRQAQEEAERLAREKEEAERLARKNKDAGQALINEPKQIIYTPSSQNLKLYEKDHTVDNTVNLYDLIDNNIPESQNIYLTAIYMTEDGVEKVLTDKGFKKIKTYKGVLNILFGPGPEMTRISYFATQNSCISSELLWPGNPCQLFNG